MSDKNKKDEKVTKKRKSICINLSYEQLGRFDFCRDIIDEKYDGNFFVSRTDTLNYLCKYFIEHENLQNYYSCVVDDNIPEQELEDLERTQYKFPF